MEVQLTIEQPNGTVSDHRFTEEPITVGSGMANHVVFEDPDLAAHQLILFREKGRWVVRNLAQGVEVQCDENLLPPGETHALQPESRIQMGNYAVDWCSDAPPEDAQKELARPRVLEPAAVAEGTDSSWTNDPEQSGQETADAAASDFSGDIFDDFNEDTHTDTDSEFESAMEGAEEITEEGGEQEFPFSEETMTSEMLTLEMGEEESMTNLVSDLEVPDDIESGGEVEEVNNLDFFGEEAGSDLVQQEAYEVNPFLEEDLLVETETTPRVTIQGYDRMRPFRTYPMLVNITHTDTSGQPVDATGSGDAEGPFARFVPSLPGCVVTPASARADVRFGVAGLKFWVTPVATGRFEDAQVHVMWEGRAPARIQMPLSLVRNPAAKIWAFLALVTGLLTLFQRQSGWDVEANMTGSLPTWAASPLLKGIEAVGGAVNFGLAVTGLFMVLALVAFLMRRPRSITLTTSPPQE